MSANRLIGSPATCRAATSEATIAPALLPATRETGTRPGRARPPLPPVRSPDTAAFAHQVGTHVTHCHQPSRTGRGCPGAARRKPRARSTQSATIHAEEMHVPRLRVQAHPAAPCRWIASVGARHDRRIDYLAGTGDSPVQVGVRTQFFHHVDLHFDTEAAHLEMFGTDPDDDLPAAPAISRGTATGQSPSDTAESTSGRVNKFIAGDPMKPATKTLAGFR